MPGTGAFGAIARWLSTKIMGKAGCAPTETPNWSTAHSRQPACDHLAARLVGDVRLQPNL
jgi:hypothetical protein